MAKAFLLLLVGEHLFIIGGQTVSLRWLALFRDFEGLSCQLSICLAYLYSSSDTLNRGTLCQLVGPWKLLKIIWSPWVGATPVADPGKSDYEEFSGTRLMPSLLAPEGLATSAIIDLPPPPPPRLPWSVYAYGPDDFAQERPVGRNTNVTGYPFPEGTRAVISISSLFLFLSILAFEYCSLSFKIQPTIQEHEEFVLLAGNLKLELIKYSRQLYGGGDDKEDDDDDSGGGGGGDGVGGSKSTPSHQLRKRRSQ
ncbi:hypothetical protein SO802_021422 [Lithocarpus litseifolius]|uniref:Uncharacterized protein n=1 Tax=Lithocarpus litseifolius TaxID=425828 RepID=A0AAW2CEW0_9ROSI